MSSLDTPPLAALQQPWDVVVIGAGVAGAVAAYRLARHGLSVLLVDKSDWPRHKICGGCVNAAALHALAAAGLADVCAAGRPYSAIRLAVGRRKASLSLPTGRAISRRRMDAALVERATAAGACFAPATHAVLDDCDAQGRRLRLRRGSEWIAVRTKLVLACDGLTSRLLHNDAYVAPRSHIGVGTVITNAPPAYPPGAIHMASGPHGYVGLVRIEGEQLDISAALDPGWVKSCGGPAAAVAQVLQTARFPAFDALWEARWQGTPRLTRRQGRLGANRLLALGDAAGYVEPFTGEGMAWAIASATAVEPFALAAIERWRGELVDAWTVQHRALIQSRQRTCRGVAALLRRPRLAAGAVALAAAAPIAAAPLTAWLYRDFKHIPTESVEII